ncbi:uncharacterized protein DNG_01723 [Cephalotrichum gorgonifer]|uniref:Peptidase S8/S53 domain-containing protein n=1 Tax=Cephalotrichum gorgonifer TaxID=2041049 RepID=A0AAE8MS28_9PEZI|nr:uncharacterized protein DNG_01723 [Cephalotrichum gorgonifer]
MPKKVSDFIEVPTAVVKPGLGVDKRGKSGKEEAYKPDKIQSNSNDALTDDEDNEKFQVLLQHKRLVNSWMKGPGQEYDLNNEKYAEYKNALNKLALDNENVLHRAIQALKEKKSSRNIGAGNIPDTLLTDKALDVIEQVVVDNPTFFTDSARDQIPLFEAPKCEAAIFLRIIKLVVPNSVAGRLNVTSKECRRENEVCPLWDVTEKRRRQCEKGGNVGENVTSFELVDKEERQDAQSSIEDAQSSLGDEQSTLGDEQSSLGDREGIDDTHMYRCLHDEIDAHKVLREDERLRKALRVALRDRERVHSDCLKPLLVAKRFDCGLDGRAQTIPRQSFETFLDLCPSDVFDEAPEKGPTPLQIAVQLFSEQSLDYELLFTTIEALVNRRPKSIFLSTGAGDSARTAYRILKTLKAAKEPENTLWRSRAEELLKRKCIGYREPVPDKKKQMVDVDLQETKRNFLYWDLKAEKRFSLTLMDESVMLDKSYIETVRDLSGMKFETVLEFIRLPYWKPLGTPSGPRDTEERGNRAPDPGSTANPGSVRRDGSEGRKVSQEAELDPYKTLFEWLWEGSPDGKNKVRKIFTVEVDDSGPEPHSNAAIREAMRGRADADGNLPRDFGVEVWKWKKFDICADTVATAVPDAHEVYLYSQGNTAVLRGWACDLALSRLKRLKKLIIEIYPKNANDKADCLAYKKGFKRGIREQCPWLEDDDISYTIPDSSGEDDGSNQNGVGKGRDGKGQISSLSSGATLERKDWVGRLKKFNGFMTNITRSLSPRDKPLVEVALLDDGVKLMGLEGDQTGWSFRGDGIEYFVGPCVHGTEMAGCIREVCPMTTLRICRLDDSKAAGNDKFTIKSCSKALRWAIDNGVEIISMSWSYEWKFESQDENDDKAEFAGLVKEAARKAILFAALPDKEVQLQEVAPVGLSDDVIKIGSATRFGKVTEDNALVHSDFILPGEEIQRPGGPPAKGSSYATAYAAGLAAMVLCCLQAHCELVAEEGEDKRPAKMVRVAKTAKGMRTVFRNLSGDGGSKDGGPPFLQPYHVFGESFLDGKGYRLEKLREISTTMLSPTDLKGFPGV